ncbi:hypothetical protein [Ancylomarina longa]|uniref:Uncharacterized protein n=1 Tax=Ancylomarina longa TaxID=2487017 RepID=A0A434AVN9_9BACT|nr:hypothetical protein [Ancylomarina longa]RUT78446.1 hypothetical protein DLK05_07665 [Ancylomarina longa]
MKDNWIEYIENKIDTQVESFISKRDYRFYQIEKLKKIAALLHKQNLCLDCKYAKSELEILVDDLDRLINKSGVNKSEYEKRVEKLIIHLKKQHDIYQAFHFTYTYTAIYTLVGSVFGLLLTYGWYYYFNPSLFFMCVGAGLFVGNILGYNKDKKYRSQGKQI